MTAAMSSMPGNQLCRSSNRFRFQAGASALRIAGYRQPHIDSDVEDAGAGMTMEYSHRWDQVLHFWFEEITQQQWWKVDPAFDQLIVERFSTLHEQANRCELFEWRREPQGRLAEVIVLDQFSRNMYRGDPRAFASDPLALALAQEAVAVGADTALTQEQRSFLYMPYMHSESRVIHTAADVLFNAHTSESRHDFELRHKAIIDRFDRYPHRNAILGRESTDAELEFLAGPGAGF
jgi:uncharacterized protein (DUF924 family)